MKRVSQSLLALEAVWAATTISALAQFTAYNDHFAGATTHTNATAWNALGTASGAPGNAGLLKDIVTGLNTLVTVTITTNHGGVNWTTGNTMSGPNAGTPAGDWFRPYIDFGTGTLPHAIQLRTGASVTYAFSGLDPAKRYRFRGTAARGNADNDRWAVCTLNSAVSFTSTHVPVWSAVAVPTGALTATEAPTDLGANQVAWQVGENRVGGVMASWEQIDPGADGAFSVTISKYNGAVPGGQVTSGTYAYALSALSLEETVISLNDPVAITQQPTNQTLLGGQPASLVVGVTGSSPVFQWYKEGVALLNATNNILAFSAVSPTNSGSYHVTVTNHLNVVTSQVATLTVFPDQSVTLVDLTNTTWRYDQSGADLGMAWKETDFNDQAWANGRGVLAQENNALVTPLTNTVLSLTNPAGQRILTYYFRTHFNFAGDPTRVYLSFTNLIDDGCIVYLNGAELYRINLANGPVTAGTLAANATEGVFIMQTVLPTNLVAGDNVLAVEVHQTSSNSTDVVMGLAVKAAPLAQGPVVLWRQPQNQAVYPGGTAGFEVTVSGMTPMDFRWFKDGIGLADDGRITGVNTSHLRIAGISEADLGAYTVAISNAFGTGLSSAAGLTLPPPLVTEVWHLGGANEERIREIAVDGAGQVLVFGRLSGPLALGMDILDSAGSNDLFLAQFDAAKVLQWAWRIGGPGEEGGGQGSYGGGLAVDAAGNSYIASTFQGAFAVGANNLSSLGGDDILVAKFNAAGQLQWVRQMGGPGNDRATDVAVDTNGNVFVTGSFSGTGLFGGVSLTSRGDTDIFTAKFTSAGVMDWVRQAGGTAHDEGFAVGVDRWGNCYATGWYQNGADFGGTNLINSGDYAFYLAKYNSAGALQWVRSENTGDNGTAIAVDDAGNVFVTGGFFGSPGATRRFGSATFTCGGSDDLFLAKYNPEGLLQWVRGATGARQDWADTLALDALGNIYLAGRFSPTVALGGVEYHSRGGEDAFVAKYSPNGVLLWMQELGGPQDDLGYGLALGPSNVLYVAGTFQATAAFNPHRLTAQGGDDSFVVKLVDLPNAPRIETQMENQVVRAGDNVILAVTATGPGPFAYQWFREGIPLTDNSRVHGAAAATLNLTHIAASDLGAYSVRVANAYGAAQSANAVLVFAPPAFAWVRQGGSSSEDTYWDYTDEGWHVALDRSNNVLAVGKFYGTATFDQTNLVSAGSGDLFIAKYSPAGTLLWIRQAGAGGIDNAYDVVVDANDNFYVGGTFNGTVQFGGSVLTSAGDWDAFVAKYNAAGVLQWVRRGGGANRENVHGLAVDAEGNVFACGRYSINTTFGNTNLTSVGGFDFFVAKYNTLGDLQWIFSGGSVAADNAPGIAATPSGDCFVTGILGADAIVGPINLATIGGDDAFAARISAAGELVWITRLGSAGSDWGVEVASDPAGHCLVSGRFGGPAMVGANRLDNLGGDDAFVVKLNGLNGEPLWARTLGSIGDDYAPGITTDASGNGYVVGHFGAATELGGIPLASAGSNDLFVAKYDPQGVLQWVQTAGGPGNDHAWAVIAKGDDNICLTGYFSLQANFGPYRLTSFGGQDIFVAKLTGATATTYDLAAYSSVVSGSVFTNRMTWDGLEVSLVETVAVSEVLHGVPTLEKLAYVNGNYDHSAYWSLSALGLQSHKSRSLNSDRSQSVAVNDRPWLVAPLHWHDGMTFSTQQAYQGTNLASGAVWSGTNYSTMICMGQETITVAGNLVDTVKFAWELSYQETTGYRVTNSMTLWHRLGVGPVKQHIEQVIHDPGNIRTLHHVDIETISFLIPAVAPPVLTSPVYANPMGCSFRVNVQTNRIYRVQGSSDLVHWSDLTATTSLGTALDFTDAEATNWTIRSYRVVSP